MVLLLKKKFNFINIIEEGEGMWNREREGALPRKRVQSDDKARMNAREAFKRQSIAVAMRSTLISRAYTRANAEEDCQMTNQTRHAIVSTPLSKRQSLRTATHDYYAKDEDDMMTSADVIANPYHDTFVVISLKTSAATFDIGTIRGHDWDENAGETSTDDDSETDVRVITSSLSL